MADAAETGGPAAGVGAEDEERIAAGLAELQAVAAALETLDLEGVTPELAFDPAWPDEGERR